jgi:hypothetical protein
MNYLFKFIVNKTDKIYDLTGHYLIQGLLIFHIIYFAIVFGVITFDINYINILNYFVHTIVCFLLIIRFNPYRENNHLHPNDPKIIFSISIFLLLNMFVMEVIRIFFPNHHKNIEKIKHVL